MEHKPSYKYKAEIIKVIDGDTIDCIIDLGFNILIKERLRLRGVDTPETRTRDKKEKARGLKAKEFVKNAIQFKDVLVETKEKGKFGRYLAIIWYQNITGKWQNLNLQLIIGKLAKEYKGGKR